MAQLFTMELYSKSQGCFFLYLSSEMCVGQKKPKSIQVVEFPTYSFGLKPSNVRCLESSFNEGGYLCQLVRSVKYYLCMEEAGASCHFLVGLGKFLSL